MENNMKMAWALTLHRLQYVRHSALRCTGHSSHFSFLVIHHRSLSLSHTFASSLSLILRTDDDRMCDSVLYLYLQVCASSERIMYTIPNTNLIIMCPSNLNVRGANNGFFVVRMRRADVRASCMYFLYGHNSIAQAEKEFRFNFPTNFFSSPYTHFGCLGGWRWWSCHFPPHK